MKKCLQCEQVYGDETNFCLSDGSTLVSVSGSFSSHAEAPTVYSGSPAPTSYGNAPFVPPVSAAPAESSGSKTFLIAAAVGFFALLFGGAIVGLVMYGIFNAGSSNVANVSKSNDQSNQNTPSAQKSGNDNPAQNLKQQQEKIERDKKRLEDERKALDAKKKEAAQKTPPVSTATTATVIDPPSNVRASPNGAIICVARTRGTVINILGPTGVSDNNGVWYYTDYCGREGVIHSSQIRF